MTTTDVVSLLRRDRPLFHYADEDVVRRAAKVGCKTQVGEWSLAVAPQVLNAIAGQLSEEMTTIETGAGHTTVLFAALARHHYCCTFSQREADKVREYLSHIDVPLDKVTFLVGPSDETLPRLDVDQIFDYAYIDGCHGYPFPALDWHYIDKHLKIGGVIGMDNAEIRPIREHCEFLEENGSYQMVSTMWAGGTNVRFYQKLRDEQRDWVDQAYSRAKKDPCDFTLATRIRRKATKWLKPHLF